MIVMKEWGHSLYTVTWFSGRLLIGSVSDFLEIPYLLYVLQDSYFYVALIYACVFVIHGPFLWLKLRPKFCSTWRNSYTEIQAFVWLIIHIGTSMVLFTSHLWLGAEFDRSSNISTLLGILLLQIIRKSALVFYSNSISLLYTKAISQDYMFVSFFIQMSVGALILRFPVDLLEGMHIIFALAYGIVFILFLLNLLSLSLIDEEKVHPKQVSGDSREADSKSKTSQCTLFSVTQTWDWRSWLSFFFYMLTHGISYSLICFIVDWYIKLNVSDMVKTSTEDSVGLSRMTEIAHLFSFSVMSFSLFPFVCRILRNLLIPETNLDQSTRDSKNNIHFQVRSFIHILFLSLLTVTLLVLAYSKATKAWISVLFVSFGYLLSCGILEPLLPLFLSLSLDRRNPQESSRMVFDIIHKMTPFFSIGAIIFSACIIQSLSYRAWLKINGFLFLSILVFEAQSLCVFIRMTNPRSHDFQDEDEEESS